MKRTKRSLFKADLPEVSEAHAKREVLLGLTGFCIGLAGFFVLRPQTGHWFELLVGVAVVSSLTLGGMKLAAWMDRWMQSKGE